MDIDFKQKFINVDFDKLIKQELVDYKEYVQYKKDYFLETNKNNDNYKVYQYELTELNKTESFSTDNKFIYTYIDENKKHNLKSEMKKIILSQTRLLENFQHYITILNTEIFLTSETSTRQKGFLSKFFN
jgi:hypothetical protein